MDNLIRFILDSKKRKALDELGNRLPIADVETIREEIFPAAQMVLNPPYINPHLPKMYNILRDLYPTLDPESKSELVKLEVTEYTRRPKLPQAPSIQEETSIGEGELEAAIEDGDVPRAAMILHTIERLNGNEALSKKLLTIGGAQLEGSLGHSVSCTTFILREISRHPPSEAFPSIWALANYFCKGKFLSNLERQSSSKPSDVDKNILRAVSGTGIRDLHDTITAYAIEKASPFIDENVVGKLIKRWVEYLGEKEEEPYRVTPDRLGPPSYNEFLSLYLDHKTESLVTRSMKLVTEGNGVNDFGNYMIRCLLSDYDGNYDPHYFTGLGSLLWVINKYPSQSDVQSSALHQYLEFIL
jgi:hypothetical protein